VEHGSTFVMNMGAFVNNTDFINVTGLLQIVFANFVINNSSLDVTPLFYFSNVSIGNESIQLTLDYLFSIDDIPTPPCVVPANATIFSLNGAACGAQTTNSLTVLIGTYSSSSDCTCSVGFQYNVNNGSCLPYCPGTPSCSSNGYCVNNSSVSSVPYCVCNSGWIGDECGIINCPGEPECNDRGECFENYEGNVVCQCDNLYVGTNCSILVCPGYPNNVCSGRGICSDANGAPACYCTVPGYYGDACNETYINTTSSSNSTESTSNSYFMTSSGNSNNNTTSSGNSYNTTTSSGNSNNTTSSSSTLLCPSDIPGAECNGHGSCIQGTCICDNYWTNADTGCALRKCPGYPLNCNQRGNCTGNDTYSYCVCSIEGWIGDGCDMINETYCPNNCSGFNCDSKSVPICVCENGTTGIDCSEKSDENSPTIINTFPVWETVVLIVSSFLVAIVVVFVIIISVPSLRFKIFKSKKIRHILKKKSRAKMNSVNTPTI